MNPSARTKTTYKTTPRLVIPEAEIGAAKPSTKTSDRRCVFCQREIHPGHSAHVVHLVNGGADVLHPNEEKRYVPDTGDRGFHLIEHRCRRRLGLRWSVPEPPTPEALRARVSANLHMVLDRNGEKQDVVAERAFPDRDPKAALRLLQRTLQGKWWSKPETIIPIADALGIDAGELYQPILG